MKCTKCGSSNILHEPDSTGKRFCRECYEYSEGNVIEKCIRCEEPLRYDGVGRGYCPMCSPHLDADVEKHIREWSRKTMRVYLAGQVVAGSPDFVGSDVCVKGAVRRADAILKHIEETK